MPHINFNATGLYAFERTLLSPARRADRLKPVLDVIGTRMLNHERILFATGGASVGRPWTPLDADTLARKRRGGFEHATSPLVATQRLMRSLSDRGHPDQILEITQSYIRFGTRVDYAAFHDTGTSHIPQRKPIMFTVKDSSDYFQTIQDFIFEGKLPNA